MSLFPLALDIFLLEVRHQALLEVRDVFAAAPSHTLVSYGKVDRLLLAKRMANQRASSSDCPATAPGLARGLQRGGPSDRILLPFWSAEEA